jgi:hypothetical protein
MSQADWNTTDRIMYGVMCSGIALWAIATFIEACRTRPKVQMMVLSVKQPAKPGPDESSSAAE